MTSSLLHRWQPRGEPGIFRKSREDHYIQISQCRDPNVTRTVPHSREKTFDIVQLQSPHV